MIATRVFVIMSKTKLDFSPQLVNWGLFYKMNAIKIWYFGEILEEQRRKNRFM